MDAVPSYTSASSQLQPEAGSRKRTHSCKRHARGRARIGAGVSHRPFASGRAPARHARRIPSTAAAEHLHRRRARIGIEQWVVRVEEDWRGMAFQALCRRHFGIVSAPHAVGAPESLRPPGLALPATSRGRLNAWPARSEARVPPRNAGAPNGSTARI
jgi:hypothetical protein